MTEFSLKRVTPIHVVDAIEPALAFWATAGFEKIVEVPHEAHLGFVLLARGDAHLMLQSRASADADVPALAAAGSGLYLDVTSLDEALAQIAGFEVVLPRRKTFYGADEIWVRDPAGVIFGLAASAG